MTSFEQLSPQEFAGQAALLQEDYMPAPEVIEHTRHVDLTSVTGPAGVGKDTVVGLTGLPQVVSDTVRDKRVNNGVEETDGNEYFFRGHELSEVLKDIQDGQYVQWTLNPGTGNLYGSRNIAYPKDGGPALIDVMADSVPKLREITDYFQSLSSVYLVAENYSLWRERLEGRGQLSVVELNQRLDEALTSLESGLSDVEMHFILNRHRDDAAKSLRLVAERNYESRSLDENHARNCGHLMLRGLKLDMGLPVSV